MLARLLVLALALALAPGCFIWEELEAGEEIMEEHGGGFSRTPGQDEGSERAGREGAPAPQEEGEEADPSAWWSKARTLTPGGGSDASEGGSAVVRCRLEGASRFMRRDECVGRGGTPAG